jgi:hypothetical protein
MQLKQKNFKVFLKKSFQRSLLQYGRSEKFVEDQDGNKLIIERLKSCEPVMIARYGSTELQCLAAYIRESPILSKNALYHQFHWDDVMENMHILSGFFPNRNFDHLIEFCKLMIRDTEQVDILGSWRKEEYYMKPYLETAVRIRLNSLEPYLNNFPWSKYLEGKKVLVIHPFSNTIKSQYEKRHLLFNNTDILPEFKLTTIRAVQTIAGNEDPRFNTWFEALDFMKSELDKSDYEIALIGCGAYGFPLAAHVKRSGKIAIQLGGSLQLLFGIKGKRWENRQKFADLMNEHWVYPSDEDIPKNKDVVEGGCYWK